MTESSAPTPERIFEVLDGHQRTAALKAGVDLELFSAINEGKTTSKALAARCGVPERGVRILCDFLTRLDFLEKKESSIH